MAFMKFYVGNEANASSHRDGIYIAVDTKKIFYNGSAYGGSEVDLSNYYTIAQVNGKIGTNVYTGANYISKETNLTEAVLQLDGEIKATNDNLALEHTNAEATYAKKTELGKKLDISTYTSDKATFALKSEIPNVSNFLTISNAQSTYLTKTDAKNNYQPKGSYLTSVSIATISDLNSGWDALLKAAPNIPSLNGYATQEWVNGRGFLTKTTADGYYQPKGNYLTSVSWSQISDRPTILALGTTSSTAFRGDYGNTAYQHAAAKGAAFSSGLYKITTNEQGHVTAATKVVKSDITALGIPGSDSNPVFQVYHGETKETLVSSSVAVSLSGVPSIVSSTRTDTIREQRLSFPQFGLKKGPTGVYMELLPDAVLGIVPTATTSADGLMSSEDKTKLNGLKNYTLPKATESTMGGIKLGGDNVISSTNVAEAATSVTSKIYAVQLNSAGKAVVYVPWTDTNTTYSAISTSEIDAVFDALFS